jgi:hypothetical protein
MPFHHARTMGIVLLGRILLGPDVRSNRLFTRPTQGEAVNARQHLLVPLPSHGGPSSDRKSQILFDVRQLEATSVGIGTYRR